MTTTTETRRVLCNGFHGEATITLSADRVISAIDEYGHPFDAVWMSSEEIAAHAPCGMADCVCGDTLTLVEAQGDDWFSGPYLVRLF